MLTLTKAREIADAAFAHAQAAGYKPLALCVLDVRGALKFFSAQDGTSLKRGEIALGKANGAMALGLGSRALMQRAETQAYFIAGATAATGGSLVPVPGGVLIKQDGAIIGAVGISGDTSDHDEASAIAGISHAGFEADGG